MHSIAARVIAPLGHSAVKTTQRALSTQLGKLRETWSFDEFKSKCYAGKTWKLPQHGTVLLQHSTSDTRKEGENHPLYGSTTSAKVRAVLIEAGVCGVRPVEVDLRKGEQHSQEFKELNSEGGVPVLIQNGQITSQSNVILDQILKHVPTRLLAKPYLQSDQNSLVQQIQESTIQFHGANNPKTFSRVLDAANKVCGTTFTPQQKQSMMSTAIRANLQNYFEGVESKLEMLKKTGAPLQALEHHVAGFDVWMMGLNAERHGFDMKDFPLTQDLFKAIDQKPSAQEARP